MNNAVLIRDKVVRLLKSEKGFNSLVSVEINGCLSAAADIALPGKDGDCDVFRIAVVPHDARKYLKSTT